MVVLHVREIAGKWFGLACAGEGLVATAVAPSREAALGALRRDVPPRAPHRLGDCGSAYAARTLAWLAELESGQEGDKDFVLAGDYVSEPRSTVLRVAAAIPLGYVTSYGDVARVAGVEARAVGGFMASNPLYPIVPCHRVVGANLSLVGYAGSTGPAALAAKLAKLQREARGLPAGRVVTVGGGSLRLYPVEWAIAKAKNREAVARGRTLFD